MDEEQMDARDKKKRPKDLDELSGSWTVEETEELDRALREQRRPDRELWEE